MESKKTNNQIIVNLYSNKPDCIFIDWFHLRSRSIRSRKDNIARIFLTTIKAKRRKSWGPVYTYCPRGPFPSSRGPLSVCHTYVTNAGFLLEKEVSEHFGTRKSAFKSVTLPNLTARRRRRRRRRKSAKSAAAAATAIRRNVFFRFTACVPAHTTAADENARTHRIITSVRFLIVLVLSGGVINIRPQMFDAVH